MKYHAEKCATKAIYNPENTADNPLTMECDCDGYHTFDELYAHRIELYIALSKQVHLWDSPMYSTVWKSKRHSDGELAFGGDWFVLGINSQKGEQITYHIPISRWKDCYFAKTLQKAPEFDGHMSDDVLKRLRSL